jgi:hypothetical protein
MTFGGIGASGEFKTINHDGGGTARLDYEPARGDVTGLVDNLLVIGLQGRPVSSLAPISGYVLSWDGTDWSPTSLQVVVSGSLTHNLLSPTHPDTIPSSPLLGDIIAGNSSSSWARFPVGVDEGQSLSVASGGGLEWRDTNVIPPIIINSGSIYNAPDKNLRIVVAKTAGSPTIINLPGTPLAGQEIIVKDGKGDASLNNITVSPPSGSVIDGWPNVKMRINWQSLSFMYNGTDWNII